MENTDIRIPCLVSDSLEPVSISLPDTRDTYSINIAEDALITWRHIYPQDYLGIRTTHEEKLMSIASSQPKSYRKIAEETLEGEYIYACHWFDYNISHFNINCLSTLHLAHKNGLFPGDMHIILNTTTRFSQELIRIYNLPIKRLIRLTPYIAYKVERIHYGTGYLGYPIDATIVEDFSRIYQSVAGDYPKKIYISRLTAGRRAPTNERDIINFLKHHGFTIINFDNMPVRMQIALINHAEIILAPHGASGVNLLYRNNTRFRFIELFPTSHITPWHIHILQNKNCDYTAIVGKSHTPEDRHSNYYIDLQSIAKSLDYVSFSFTKNL